jgi:hypothetical protein
VNAKQIAEAIETNCGSDLDRIEQSGVPRKAVIVMAVTAAERRCSFTPATTEAFRNQLGEYRDRETRAAKDLESIDNLRNKRCAIEVPESFQPPQAWRDSRKNLGAYLREHGRTDHDQAIPILVSSILSYRRRTRFDCWMELARVLRVAYVASGRVPDADDIKAATLHTALLRARRRTSKGVKA